MREINSTEFNFYLDRKAIIKPMHDHSIKEFKIGDRIIGNDFPPFIIAELSGNHNGSLERALSLIDAAADAGADAVKLQTYGDTLVDSTNAEFRLQDYGRVTSI